MGLFLQVTEMDSYCISQDRHNRGGNRRQAFVEAQSFGYEDFALGGMQYTLPGSMTIEYGLMNDSLCVHTR